MSEAPTERWLPVVGHEGYYDISDHGRVWSRISGRTLRPTPSTKGHLRVNLRGKNRYVHALVLEAFVGPCPDGMEGCHNDGDPALNRADNLRWDTPSSNQRDRTAHGNNRFALATHCPHGHEYTEQNTLWQSFPRADGTGIRWARRCRTCVRASTRRWLAEHPERRRELRNAYRARRRSRERGES